MINLKEKLAEQLKNHQNPIFMMSESLYKKMFPLPLVAVDGKLRDLGGIEIILDDTVPPNDIWIGEKE